MAPPLAYIQILTFSQDINCSLQIGDQVYKTSTSPFGGFEQNTSQPIHIGHVHNIISSTQIEVYSTYVDGGGVPLPYNSLDPSGGDYISFSKNRVVNNNDLLGYYASVNFVNDSKLDAKLWAVGMGGNENSK